MATLTRIPILGSCAKSTGITSHVIFAQESATFIQLATLIRIAYFKWTPRSCVLELVETDTIMVSMTSHASLTIQILLMTTHWGRVSYATAYLWYLRKPNRHASPTISNNLKSILMLGMPGGFFFALIGTLKSVVVPRGYEFDFANVHNLQHLFVQHFGQRTLSQKAEVQ